MLSWKAPKSTGGIPLTGYILLRGIDEESLVVFRQLDGVTSFIDDSLVGGDGFYYAVVAVNDLGASDPAGPVFKKVPGPSEGEDEISIWLIVIIIVLLVIVLVGGIMIVLGKASEPSLPESSVDRWERENGREAEDPKLDKQGVNEDD